VRCGGECCDAGVVGGWEGCVGWACCGRAVVDGRWQMRVALVLLGGSVCEERSCGRSVCVVGRGWVCWMGGVCELIFVFTEGIEASGEGGTEGIVLDCMGEGVGCVGGCVSVMDLEVRWDTQGCEGLGAIF
jgi:hypothetical protein